MKYIIGIDEVGRGSWAGPLTVGAVALKIGEKIENLRDSKKLTKKQRYKMARKIKACAAGIGVGFVGAEKIDQIGLTNSLKLAAEIAFQQIPPEIRAKTEQIIIDGNIKLLRNERATTLIKADDKIQSVSAASVIAKVFRDDFMSQIGKFYPNFQLEKNVGYGTKNHSEALKNFGAIRNIHRFSFQPVAKIAQKTSTKPADTKTAKTSEKSKISKTIGRIAENVAADFLRKKQFKILAQNWRTKFCEIDIVAQKDNSLFFVEVKFRENNLHGDGFSAITEKKIRQMQKSAEIFIQKNPDLTRDKNLHLSAISLAGTPPIVQDFLPEIF